MGTMREKKWYVTVRWLPLALGLVYTFWVVNLLVPYLQNPWQFDDDHAQHGLAYRALQEPDHFPDGFMAHYAIQYQPLGYRLLLENLTGAFGVEPALKGTGVVLLVLTLWAAFACGWRLAGSWAGLLVMILFGRHADLHNAAASGLFRGFGPLLMFGLVWFLSGPRPARAWWILLAAPLFYPPLWLVIAPAVVLSRLPLLQRGWPAVAQELKLAAPMALASLGLMLVYSDKGEEIGELIPFARMEQMAEWNRHDGRFRELPMKSIDRDLSRILKRGLETYPHGKMLIEEFRIREIDGGVVLGVMAVVALGLAMSRSLPLWWWALGLASFAGYFAARWFAFSLGWPDRYLSYSWPVLCCMVFPQVLVCLRSRSTRLGRNLCCTVMVALLFVLLVTPMAPEKPKHHVVTLDEAQRKVYEFFAGLEKPVLVAGSIRDLDALPLLTGCETFIDYEHAHPLYETYYETCAKRLRATERLIYAVDKDKAIAWRNETGVTHLLVRQIHYRAYDARYPSLFQPYTNRMLDTRAESFTRFCYFRDNHAKGPVFKAGPFWVYDLRTL